MNAAARRLAWAQRIAVVALALFWISFWHDHSELPANVVDFEWCFLMPDLVWIGGAFLFSSHWLVTGHRLAALGSAAGGSAMVYLGLLDAACNLRHGQYTESLDRGVLNVAVNFACVVFGGANIWWAAKQGRTNSIR